MTRKEVIDKIIKLIELASSPNEHEAKLAMKRAQELMAKYSIDHIYDKEEKQVIHYWILNHKNYNIQTYLQVSTILSKVFGCFSYAIASLEPHVVIMGFPTNVQVVTAATDSVYNQAFVLYKEGYKKQRSVSFGISFWQGFLIGLAARFKESGDEGTGLTVYDPVKAEHNKMEFLMMGLGHAGDNEEAKKYGHKAAHEVQLRPSLHSEQPSAGKKFLG